MPYADPEKKRQYQKSYNRQYYRRNKTRKNLVNKAVSSKQKLRDQKRQYLWDYFHNQCSRCGFDEVTDLVIVPKDPARRAVWTSRDPSGSDTPRYILDYSWDTLNDTLRNLDLLCSRCRGRITTPSSVSELSDQLSELSGDKSLPKGYVLDEDLSIKTPITKSESDVSN